MLLSIIITPLLVFLVLSFFGRYLGHNGAAILAPGFMVGNAVFSFVAFYYVGILGHFTYICLGTWIDCGLFVVNWGFVFDSLTVTMLIVVNTVSAVVHVYSVFYMESDPHFTRFMAYLSLFTFFMLVLVSADNFIQLFLGWEGVGLCSYLLINFWHTRVQANKAALKAIVLNRVGDFGLTFAILLIFFYFKSVDFSTVFLLAPLMSEFFFTYQIDLVFFTLQYNIHILSFICFCLFVGAVGKSAQIGLHTWLPDAMEGPTPVSALIHAATMVTAGVFLIIRCSPLFEYAPAVLTFMVFVGAITSFFAATTGMVQHDIKKIIAYSTCSQLGYMVFACGLSGYSVGLFHLVNHAFFKALLFLSAGAVIHSLSNEQDIRRMGGLAKIMPLTYTMFLIGSLSLIGFPFLSGFYSKDLILELAYSKYTLNSHFVYWLGTITALLTAFYSFRLIYFVFFNRTNVINSTVLKNIHDVPLGMAVPLMVLCFGSIFSGYFFKDIFVGPGTDFFAHTIPMGATSSIINAEFIPIWAKLIPTYFSFTGLVLAIFFSGRRSRSSLLLFKATSFDSYFFKKFRYGFKFLNNKWNFDLTYNYYFSLPLLRYAHKFCFIFIDQYFLKFFGPIGISLVIYKTSNLLAKNQSGLIPNYAFFMSYFLLGFLFIIWLGLVA
jgi:proton-translocating NADH-quinone oxidoreductase chain L